MKKDKEWLKEEIEIMKSETSENYPHEQMVEREVVLNLIDQLDEPEASTQGWIGQYTRNNHYTSRDELDDAFSILRDIYHQSKTADWVAKENRNSEIFARAWLDGYEVEKEQKYYVMNNDNRMMLVRMMDGKTITEADPFKLEDMYEGEKKSHRLTEQEIKDYDLRYWAFAVPVEVAE